MTAAFALWLIERVAEVEHAATRQDLEALTAEVAALRAALQRQD